MLADVFENCQNKCLENSISQNRRICQNRQKGIYFRNRYIEYIECPKELHKIMTTISFIIFETFQYFTKFSFQHK